MDTKTMEMRLTQWMPIFEEQAKSGMGKDEWCKANGIRRWEFYKRQRECRNYILENASGCEKLPVPAGNLPSFFEIPVNHQTPSVETGLTESDSIKDKSDGSHIMINYGNFSIDVAGPVNGKTLREVIRAVADA